MEQNILPFSFDVAWKGEPTDQEFRDLAAKVSEFVKVLSAESNIPDCVESITIKRV